MPPGYESHSIINMKKTRMTTYIISEALLPFVVLWTKKFLSCGYKMNCGWVLKGIMLGSPNKK